MYKMQSWKYNTLRSGHKQLCTFYENSIVSTFIFFAKRFIKQLNKFDQHAMYQDACKYRVSYRDIQNFFSDHLLGGKFMI